MLESGHANKIVCWHHAERPKEIKMTKYTSSQIAQFFGVSVDAVKKQYASNARDLATLAAKANGKKVNGYTQVQLQQMSADALAKSI
jgi:hypothetical protein